jgi:hypothetical protein
MKTTLCSDIMLAMRNVEGNRENGVLAPFVSVLPRWCHRWCARVTEVPLDRYLDHSGRPMSKYLEKEQHKRTAVLLISIDDLSA